MRNTFLSSSVGRSTCRFWTRNSETSTFNAWPLRSSQNATGTFSFSDCRHFTIAIFCTRAECALSCHRHFFMRVAMGLAMREIDRDVRAIDFYELLFLLRLYVFHADAFSTPARFVRSSRLAFLQPSPMIWTVSLRPSRTMPCCPSMLAASATIGAASAVWVRTFEEQSGESQGVVPISQGLPTIRPSR